MDLSNASHEWNRHGFAVLPGYLPEDVLTPAVAELASMFPSAHGFHDGSDPRRDRFVGDEFAGIDSFPFTGTEVALLAVHDLLIDLAEELLGSNDLRLYTAEAWAKYTGAADYDQHLHRDYLNHTVLVPSSAPAFKQVEMFVFLDDVPEELGPPHLVSRTHTSDIDATPNWFPDGESGRDPAARFRGPGRPDLYEREISAAGPAGTVVAFELGTFHRGTGMARPGGARFSMHLGYRRADNEWGQRYGWALRSHEPAWYRFVERATPRQLQLFGFPPPGHAFWTDETLGGMALRYPELDLSPWLDRS
ncbi:Phytanoyl-CoA dioxygenase (PhyH) [Nocardia amikacinitolerans]|uniref:phytanoyl-CoA dioxygenase family protein n=1 Tax=Nocardia amikacinitolerans TaxID=756689 RepID=UPI000834882A|nr:phytanoyl-CoA dioxygenase family protein [Nocardia amikacinitolerans]MCP2317848.1 Phytanoyl-CoA dioxygenase (PhyH) [Nocardia amikacinitolerans]